ncbi:ABC transporter ATP-binding protein [Chloroflexota bacterium]
MTLLEVIGVTKNFGGLLAVDNVSFHVDRGEIVGLIGPNGAGKTTLFNTICAFYRPSSGIVKFKGEKISGLKPHQVCRQGIARTFQISRSFYSMTALENVMIGKLFGRNAHENLKSAREEALQLMEFAGLAEKANMSVESLTSIDTRRLELVRALAANPEIILLDEVMAGLNPLEVAEAMELIKKVRANLGITVLMIEHIMKSVMGISDRVIVLASGQLLTEGSPQEVCNNSLVIEAYLGEPFLEETNQTGTCQSQPMKELSQ